MGSPASLDTGEDGDARPNLKEEPTTEVYHLVETNGVPILEILPPGAKGIF